MCPACTCGTDVIAVTVAVATGPAAASSAVAGRAARSWAWTAWPDRAAGMAGPARRSGRAGPCGVPAPGVGASAGIPVACTTLIAAGLSVAVGLDGSTACLGVASASGVAGPADILDGLARSVATLDFAWTALAGSGHALAPVAGLPADGAADWLTSGEAASAFACRADAKAAPDPAASAVIASREAVVAASGARDEVLFISGQQLASLGPSSVGVKIQDAAATPCRSRHLPAASTRQNLPHGTYAGAQTDGNGSKPPCGDWHGSCCRVCIGPSGTGTQPCRSSAQWTPRSAA